MMETDDFIEYCRAKPECTEGFPFGEGALVFKVVGKMFAMVNLKSERPTANLKCEPGRAVSLRERHPDDIRPGYHMNKVHWNTVELSGGIEVRLIERLIDHSYERVVASLKRADRDRLSLNSKGS